MSFVFCDWLTIYQVHPYGCPRLNNGAVFSVSVDGEIEWKTERKVTHVGSFETAITISSDGHRVVVSGNLGRFGRPDNVFGVSVLQCVEIANQILGSLGLPAFSSGQSFNRQACDGSGYTGAIITRIDLTRNYCLGSTDHAARFIQFCGRAASGKHTPRLYGRSGVTWGEGSKFWYAKLYAKYESLGEHATERVQEWVKDNGVVRHEICLKSRYLTQNNIRFIEDWDPQLKGQVMETVIYDRFADIVRDAELNRDDIFDIPGRLGDLALAWRAGKDVYGDESISISTRNRYRRALKQYGLDIKFPCDVTHLNTRVQVLKLSDAYVPSWYWDESRRAA